MFAYEPEQGPLGVDLAGWDVLFIFPTMHCIGRSNAILLSRARPAHAIQLIIVVSISAIITPIPYQH